MSLLYRTELEEFKINMQDENISDQVDELLDTLNDDNNFIINRSSSELPFGEPFRILKVANFSRIRGMEGTVLILDGTDSKFSNYNQENFTLILDEVFTSNKIVDALHELVNNHDGFPTIALSHVKKSHGIDVFRFGFVFTKKNDEVAEE